MPFYRTKDTRRFSRLVALMALLVLALAVMNLAWVFSRLDHFADPTWVHVLGDLGNLFAFNGLVLLTALCCLGTRNPIIERTVGLDAMMHWHKTLGPVTVLCFVGHAVTRTGSICLDQGIPYDVSMLYRLSLDEWELSLGRIALFIMLGATALAIAGSNYQLVRFKSWKVPHFALYAALPLGFVHGLTYGDDMPRFPFHQVWWLLLAVFVADSLWRLRGLALRNKQDLWTLESVVQETEDIATLNLTRPADGDPPGRWTRRKAGQFGIIRAPGVPTLDEPHPFTLSSPATAESPPRISFTIKELGDFSQEVATLRPGAKVICEGPYGVFGGDCEQHARLAFIAGGVGVTPFLSILRTFQARGRAIPTTLLWANRTRADAFAHDELLAMSRDLPLVVVHSFSREDDEALREHPEHGPYRFLKGRVDRELLAECFLGDEGFFICGPEAMTEAALTGLSQAFGVKRHHVARELFFW